MVLHPAPPSYEGLEARLATLGSFCRRRPWLVVAVWLIVFLAATLAGPQMAHRLQSGSGRIDGSMSERVDAQLASEFSTGDGQSLALVYRSRLLAEDANLIEALDARIEQRLMALDSVEKVVPADFLVDRADDAEGHVLLVNIAAGSALLTEQQVPLVRDAVRPVLADFAATAPDLEWAVTGRAALTYDINIMSARDTATSELRALPLAILVLLFAFGAVVSAGLPLIMALFVRALAMAAVLSAAGSWEISNLAQSIVAMLALALGIDYSLFIFHSFQTFRQSPSGLPGRELALEPFDRALRGAMAQSGRVVLYSGTAVAIGMGALLLTPLMQTRSIGLGGIAAVVFSVLAALTLLPALLSLIGPEILDWPAWLDSRSRRDRSHVFWSGWGDRVVRHPVLAITSSLLVLCLLAAPVMETRFGFPEDEFLPGDLESARGLAMLERTGMKGLVSPLFIVVSERSRRPVITSQRVAALSDFVSKISADPRVAEVYAPRLSATSRFAPIPMPMNDGLVSAGENRILLRIIPAGDTRLANLRRLAAEMPGWLGDPSLSVEVGGQAQFYNDFDSRMRNSYALIVGLVLAMTGLALLLLLRAPLAAAKAILLNLLSVAAGYGAVVFVFQLGHGSALFGLEQPTGLVPTSVPIVIFAILFGLSMDYEIFLISRMKDLFLKSGNNRTSIVEALGDTGGIITNAASIMAVVFGAFAFSSIVIVQMIGLGLAVAILVDAIVIRSILGPALMTVAGRWNWWPHQVSAIVND